MGPQGCSNHSEDVTDSLSISPYTHIKSIDPSASHILPEIVKQAKIEMPKMHEYDCFSEQCLCEGFKILTSLPVDL